MEQTLDIGALIRAYKRRWWLIVLPAILITPVVAMIAYLLPPVYQATARALVASQQIPTELAQSTVTIGVAERVAFIQQRLTTRQNLLDVAQRFDVFRSRGAMSPTEVADAMRAAIRIEGVRLTDRRGPVTGVNISFSADRPGVAADVANEFMQLLLQENLRSRNTRVVETTAFFVSEAQRLDAELKSLAQRITDFKRANQPALPESLGFRRSELAAIETRLFERELQQAALAEQRAALEQALRDGNFGAAVQRAQTAEEQELERLNVELVRARSIYTENHPRIRSYLSRIAALQGAMARAPDEAVVGKTPAEQIGEAIAKIDKQLEVIAARNEQEKARAAALEASIERTPTVELELNALEREYVNVQTQYRDMTSRQAEAALGERLEVNQQAERIEVVEQAQRPGSPVSPKRRLIVAGGFAGSLALGFGLVTLLELLNRTVRTASELERKLDLRPFGVIPYFESPRAALTRRWTWRIAPILGAILISAGVFAVDRYHKPLPVLYDEFVRTSGVQVLVEQFNRRFGG